MCMTVYKANIVKYVKNQVCSGTFKNRKSNNIPIGNGINIINHIGEPIASVIAPYETTEVPIIIACQKNMPLVVIRLPKKYDKAVNKMAATKLIR